MYFILLKLCDRFIFKRLMSQYEYKFNNLNKLIFILINSLHTLWSMIKVLSKLCSTVCSEAGDHICQLSCHVHPIGIECKILGVVTLYLR